MRGQKPPQDQLQLLCLFFLYRLPALQRQNVSDWSPPQPKQSAQAIRGKAPYRRCKWSVGLGDVDVKKRLIELWHQSLARTEKPRSWAIFSKLDRRKKAAFTARKANLTL